MALENAECWLHVLAGTERDLVILFMHLSVLSPRGGGTLQLGRCGAFDFSEGFLVKIPTVGPPKLVKSDQISPGVSSIYIEMSTEK